MDKKTYIAIDLKSFYASVECVDRELDPLNVNLVVADASRSEKTICLAVSPALKTFGLPGRIRLFEVNEKVREANRKRGRNLRGESVMLSELTANPSLAISYLIAPPRMARYMEVSSKIYSIYLRFIAPEDIHVYSIDEVFIDATNYLHLYEQNPLNLARKMIMEVLKETGITAAAGIGENLYLAKVAMDIEAKHIKADEHGVRIALLDELSYREKLWTHRPLTDFWRIGHGLSSKLEAHGMYTMGDVARRSLLDEDSLYKLFGINAELLIDHAWGYEPVTMKDIKSYKPRSSSTGQGQILPCGHRGDKARIVVREMADMLSFDLFSKKLVTDQLVLYVGYDIDNIKSGDYKGEVVTDYYGRGVPKGAHGSINLEQPSSSNAVIIEAVSKLFDSIVDPSLLIRRLNLTANHLLEESAVVIPSKQLELFVDYEKLKEEERAADEQLEKERKLNSALLDIKKRFGKNAVLRGLSYEEGSTQKERNSQIGGHKA